MEKLKSSILKNTGVGALFVATQFVVIALASRVDQSLVTLIALIEISSSLCITLILFGGEPHYINFKNRKAVGHESINLFLFLLMFAAFVLFMIAVAITPSAVLFSALNYSKLEVFLLAFIVFCISSLAIFTYSLRHRFDFIKAILVEKVVLVCAPLICILYFWLNDGQVSRLSYLAAFAIVAGSIMLVPFSKLVLNVRYKTILPGFRVYLENYFNRSGGYFYVTAILVIIFERADQVLLVALLGVSHLAGYFACYKLAFVVRFITKSVNAATYPYLSKLVGFDSAKAGEIYKYNRILNFCIALFFAVPLIVFSANIISLVFGPDYIVYSKVLEIMSLALLLSSLNQVDVGYINSKGNSHVLFYNSILTVLAQISFIIVFYPIFGFLAFAFGRLVAVVVGTVFIFFNMRGESKTILPECIFALILTTYFMVLT